MGGIHEKKGRYTLRSLPFLVCFVFLCPSTSWIHGRIANPSPRHTTLFWSVSSLVGCCVHHTHTPYPYSILPVYLLAYLTREDKKAMLRTRKKRMEIWSFTTFGLTVSRQRWVPGLEVNNTPFVKRVLIWSSSSFRLGGPFGISIVR